MPSGGFLRTNFRRSGAQTITAMGGGIPQTSFFSGPGLATPYGGFIMGSISFNGDITGGYTFGVSCGTASYSALCVVSAYGAMSAWFGGGLYGSGYAIMPFAIMLKETNTSNTYGVDVTFSNIASGVAGPCISIGYSCFIVVPYTSALAGLAANPSLSFRAVWAGWIISSP